MLHNTAFSGVLYSPKQCRCGKRYNRCAYCRGDEVTKEVLLKRIAESAHNVGFGAKKHFATYCNL